MVTPELQSVRKLPHKRISHAVG